ncbi:MAG TPA: FAD binding domain-containing protein, partial [Hyphomicrobiaceae bacterium]|nr:FAD binding domain-containing protein [Hyphomicrobiaceae bacterium]
MIPGSFSYHRPTSVAEAAGLIAQHADTARILAGGQSLIPMMKLRLAAPEHLIDMAAVAELKGIERKGDSLLIGAMTTQHELIASGLIAETVPIIRETSLLVADPQVRYLGTLGGNLANGDPGNDMPAIMLCLDASYRLVGRGGERIVKAREFYKGTYATALDDAEILAGIAIPIPPVGHGFAYEKLKRKIGDYATAAAGVVLTAAGGKISSCAIG